MVVIFPQQKCLGVHLTLSENSGEIPSRSVVILSKGILLSQVIDVVLESNL